jgi:TRAP-type mannitol/chloroaromatic compound transport system substrate-binding protein
MPLAQALDAPAQQAWLTVAGGQALWDELAAQFGFKPLLAGHTGAIAGVWASARLESPADLSGARLHVVGAAAEVLRALGARPVQMAACELRQALGDGHIQAAEWLGLPIAPGPLAERFYEPGFHRGGVALSLDIRGAVWQAMSAGDRAIFEACSVEEYHLSLAEARAHTTLLRQIEAASKWPVRLPWSDGVVNALDRALADVVQRIAAGDADARRIDDSYQAFRRLLGTDVVA